MILQAARLTRWKGQGVLIDAVAQLQDRGVLQGAVAILAGDAQGRDGYVKELQAQIERLGLMEHVRLVGHVEDIAAAYLCRPRDRRRFHRAGSLRQNRDRGRGAWAAR